MSCIGSRTLPSVRRDQNTADCPFTRTCFRHHIHTCMRIHTHSHTHTHTHTHTHSIHPCYARKHTQARGLARAVPRIRPCGWTTAGRPVRGRRCSTTVGGMCTPLAVVGAHTHTHTHTHSHSHTHLLTVHTVLPPHKSSLDHQVQNHDVDYHLGVEYPSRYN